MLYYSRLECLTCPRSDGHEAILCKDSGSQAKTGLCGLQHIVYRALQIEYDIEERGWGWLNLQFPVEVVPVTLSGRTQTHSHTQQQGRLGSVICVWAGRREHKFVQVFPILARLIFFSYFMQNIDNNVIFIVCVGMGWDVKRKFRKSSWHKKLFVGFPTFEIKTTFIYLSLYVFICTHAYSTGCMWRPEDNLQESILSTHNVGPEY